MHGQLERDGSRAVSACVDDRDVRAGERVRPQAVDRRRIRGFLALVHGRSEGPELAAGGRQSRRSRAHEHVGKKGPGHRDPNGARVVSRSPRTDRRPGGSKEVDRPGDDPLLARGERHADETTGAESWRKGLHVLEREKHAPASAVRKDDLTLVRVRLHEARERQSRGCRPRRDHRHERTVVRRVVVDHAVCVERRPLRRRFDHRPSVRHPDAREGVVELGPAAWRKRHHIRQDGRFAARSRIERHLDGERLAARVVEGEIRSVRDVRAKREDVSVVPCVRRRHPPIRDPCPPDRLWSHGGARRPRCRVNRPDARVVGDDERPSLRAGALGCGDRKSERPERREDVRINGLLTGRERYGDAAPSALRSERGCIRQRHVLRRWPGVRQDQLRRETSRRSDGVENDRDERLDDRRRRRRGRSRLPDAPGFEASVQSRRARGVECQRLDREIRQPSVDGGPGTAGVGGPEDSEIPDPGVKNGRRCWVHDQSGDSRELVRGESRPRRGPGRAGVCRLEDAGGGRPCVDLAGVRGIDGKGSDARPLQSSAHVHPRGTEVGGLDDACARGEDDGGVRGIDRQSQYGGCPGAGGDPGAAGVGGLEDLPAADADVERGGRSRVDRDGANPPVRRP